MSARLNVYSVGPSSVSPIAQTPHHSYHIKMSNTSSSSRTNLDTVPYDVACLIMDNFSTWPRRDKLKVLKDVSRNARSVYGPMHYKSRNWWPVGSRWSPDSASYKRDSRIVSALEYSDFKSQTDPDWYDPLRCGIPLDEPPSKLLQGYLAARGAIVGGKRVQSSTSPEPLILTARYFTSDTKLGSKCTIDDNDNVSKKDEGGEVEEGLLQLTPLQRMALPFDLKEVCLTSKASEALADDQRSSMRRYLRTRTERQASRIVVSQLSALLGKLQATKRNQNSPEVASDQDTKDLRRMHLHTHGQDTLSLHETVRHCSNIDQWTCYLDIPDVSYDSTSSDVLLKRLRSAVNEIIESKNLMSAYDPHPTSTWTIALQGASQLSRVVESDEFLHGHEYIPFLRQFELKSADGLDPCVCETASTRSESIRMFGDHRREVDTGTKKYTNE
jgi:hypothetical protein